MADECNLKTGDLVYWNGYNPDGTTELARYYVVTAVGKNRDDTILMDGDQNIFIPSPDYFPYLKLLYTNTLSSDFISGLPRLVRELIKQYHVPEEKKSGEGGI